MEVPQHKSSRSSMPKDGASKFPDGQGRQLRVGMGDFPLSIDRVVPGSNPVLF